MILDLPLAAFTQFHVVLSSIGIAAGLIVVVGMWQSFSSKTPRSMR